MEKKKSLLVIFLVLYITPVSSKINLPNIFSDHMVLQQQATSKIWGKSSVDKKVTIKTSWNNKIYSTMSNSKGYFSIGIKTEEAGGPYKIEISDGEVLTLKDVLIGEVWLCSGQSNMEMPLKGFRGQPVENSQDKIMSSKSKQDLRLFTVERNHSITPLEDVKGTWVQTSPKTAREFSATAYFFGDLLQKTLDIPVGLIHSSWSASKIEAWMSEEALSNFKEIEIPKQSGAKFDYPAGTPTLLYNAMISPLQGLAIKGVVWYQGESNSSNPSQYKKLFASWVKQWRQAFNNHQMPVYYTEIAPFQSSHKDSINLALFRECQLESMNEIDHVGMAFTTDLGHERFIHPPYKKQVGERLSYWALSKTYGIQGISYMGPVYKSSKRLSDNEVEVAFDHAEEGLIPENASIIGFELAGKDGVFYVANAAIVNGSAKVKLKSNYVSEPKEVRYCFRNYMVGNLYNNFNIPVAGFRARIN